MTGVLHLSGVRAGYGPVNVLDDLSLDVGSGEIVVILGANGAGKTTTLRAVSGMIGRSGTIEFDGVSIAKSSPDAIVRAGVAQVPQGRGTFPELSVEDNLRTGAFVRSDREIGTDIDRWFEVFPRLRERRTQRIVRSPGTRPVRQGCSTFAGAKGTRPRPEGVNASAV